MAKRNQSRFRPAAATLGPALTRRLERFARFGGLCCERTGKFREDPTPFGVRTFGEWKAATHSEMSVIMRDRAVHRAFALWRAETRWVASRFHKQGEPFPVEITLSDDGEEATRHNDRVVAGLKNAKRIVGAMPCTRVYVLSRPDACRALACYLNCQPEDLAGEFESEGPVFGYYRVLASHGEVAMADKEVVHEFGS